LIFTKKPLIVAVVASVLLAQSLASHAVTYTLSVAPTSYADGITSLPVADSSWVNGVNTTTTSPFSNALSPNSNTPLTSLAFSYGEAIFSGSAPSNGTSYSFNTDVKFVFNITSSIGGGAGAETRTFVVDGTLSGTIKDTKLGNKITYNSTTQFIANSITALADNHHAQQVNTPGHAPAPGDGTGIDRIGIDNVAFGANEYLDLFVTYQTGLGGSRNGSSVTGTSIGGYVLTVNVPEPGSVTLLTAMGLFGVGGILRHRRIRRA